MPSLPAALPYSRKALESLLETLKHHQVTIWTDPKTNHMSFKSMPAEGGRKISHEELTQED